MTRGSVMTASIPNAALRSGRGHSVSEESRHPLGGSNGRSWPAAAHHPAQVCSVNPRIGALCRVGMLHRGVSLFPIADHSVGPCRRIAMFRFGCLRTLDADHSFNPRWRPPFLSALAPEDRCHLHGLNMVDAHGETDTLGAWRENKARGDASCPYKMSLPKKSMAKGSGDTAITIVAANRVAVYNLLAPAMSAIPPPPPITMFPGKLMRTASAM